MRLIIPAVICSVVTAQSPQRPVAHPDFNMGKEWFKIGTNDSAGVEVWMNLLSLDANTPGIGKVVVRIFDKDKVVVQKWAYRDGGEYFCAMWTAIYDRKTGKLEESVILPNEFKPVIPGTIADSGIILIRKFIDQVRKSSGNEDPDRPQKGTV
jgi:hypothetical protein